jgi:ABC-2 type transport system permease protein
MWLSAVGRFRWRVLGVAVFVFLVQFLVNLVAQMWDKLAVLRPLTLFYYYQPQAVILGEGWGVNLQEWNGGRPLCSLPMPLVLYGVGVIGYLMAIWTLQRRDLPAPL